MMRNIVNKKNVRIWYLLSILLLFSCTNKFEEFNTPKSQLLSVGRAELPGLFSSATTEAMSFQMAVLAAKFYSIMPMHLCGYTATGYTNQEVNILTTGSSIDQTYERAFNKMYKNLRVILEVTQKEQMKAHYAIALVLKVYTFHRHTDIWGPIPYSELDESKERIKFDSQRDVYYQMFDELREASLLLEDELQKNPNANAYGLGDMIYEGNVEKWLRFCNSLRLRLALRISNIEPEKAKSEAESAATGIMLETNEHDGLFQTKDLTGSSQYGHGMCQMQQYLADFMSTTMESYMVGYNDPRISEYWSPVGSLQGQSNDPNFTSNMGGYHGCTSGASLEWLTSDYIRWHSLTGPRFADGNQRVTPINVVCAAETWFLKAEAAWKGWNVGGGTVEELYNKGIETSIRQWCPTIDEKRIIDYINSLKVPIAPNNYPYNDPPVADAPVKFSSNKEQQYEQIMIQKWLANYPDALEAYSELRRTRLPKIYAKKTSLNANINISEGQMIVRYPFPDIEKTTQPEEVQKAISFLGGNPDLESTPLWWDTHSNGHVKPGNY